MHSLKTYNLHFLFIVVIMDASNGDTGSHNTSTSKEQAVSFFFSAKFIMFINKFG